MKKISVEKMLFLTSCFWLLMLCSTLALNYIALSKSFIVGLEVAILFVLVYLTAYTCEEKNDADKVALTKANEKCIAIVMNVLFVVAMIFTINDKVQLNNEGAAILLLAIGTVILFLRTVLFYNYHKNVK